MGDLPGSCTLCLMIMQGDLLGARTLSDDYKRRLYNSNLNILPTKDENDVVKNDAIFTASNTFSCLVQKFHDL